MNKANIFELAEYIEELEPEQYNQRYIAHPSAGDYARIATADVAASDAIGVECGTPSCVAGHAAFLSGEWGTDVPAIRAAAIWLGLNPQQAHDLFKPIPYRSPGWTPNTQDAAWTLRYLAETGDVRWLHKYMRSDDRGER